jgi:hypothetical protein
MKLTIEGTPDEIKKVLQTVGSSEEHKSDSKLMTEAEYEKQVSTKCAH